jgi:hypothetical protein
MKEWLIEKGHQEVTIFPIEASVEDCFMALNKE